MNTKISPWNVVSLIALVLSLTGVGYAVTSLPRDSVGKAQIKPAAVGSSEVADGSLKPVDFSKAALATMAGKAGPQGGTGPAGPKGDTGAAGPAGAGGSGAGGSGMNVTGGDGTVVGTYVSWQTGSSRHITVRLPNGTLTRYEANGVATWSRDTSGPPVLSLNADCSEPRYATPGGAATSPAGAMVYYWSTLDWAYTVGTQRISPVGDPIVYGNFGSSCDPRGPLSGESQSGELVRLEPAAMPPILTTPVTIG